MRLDCDSISTIAFLSRREKKPRTVATTQIDSELYANRQVAPCTEVAETNLTWLPLFAGAAGELLSFRLRSSNSAMTLLVAAAENG